MAAGFALVIISAILTAYYLKSEDRDFKSNGRVFAAVILLSAFLLRVLTVSLVKGYETDISCFTGWAQESYRLGLAQFYSGVGFADYPPGYIYVLYATGFIADVFNIDASSVLYNFILKLPSMCTDILTAAGIYKFAKSKTDTKNALLLCAMYAFNPFVYLTSTLWGQVDSVFAFLIVSALILLYDKKNILSACIYALALLVKPQALVLFPVYIFYIISLVIHKRYKAVGEASVSALAGATVFFALVIPFCGGRGIGWIFELYYNTLSSYPYATLNAPNFYGAVGANGKAVSESFLNIPYSVWSAGFIVLICAAAASVYFKIRKRDAIFASSAVLVAGMYVLAAKMHERYIFPAVAMLIIYAALSDKKQTVCAWIFSAVTFFASAKVLSLSASGQSPWINANEAWFIAGSVLMVAIFVYMIYLIIGEGRDEIASMDE